VSEITLPDDLRDTLNKTETSEFQLYEGESGPYLDLWSRAQDVTVMGAMGAYYRGPDQVKQNAEFVASRFRGGRNERIELVAAGASGDLAYAVWVERGEALVAGRDDYAPIALRITHIFRRENGIWKIIHRHGDPVTEQAQTPPVRQG
jgi:ketosteroid isomerase-like protein